MNISRYVSGHLHTHGLSPTLAIFLRLKSVMPARLRMFLLVTEGVVGERAASGRMTVLS